MEERHRNFTFSIHPAAEAYITGRVCSSVYSDRQRNNKPTTKARQVNTDNDEEELLPLQKGCCTTARRVLRVKKIYEFHSEKEPK